MPLSQAQTKVRKISGVIEFSVLLCIRMITIYAQQHRKSDKSDDKLS